MKFLDYLGFLICLFLIKNVYSWNTETGISLFDAADLNKDDRITEDEVLTSPNKAIVKEWVALLEKFPNYVKSEGINRTEFMHLTRPKGKVCAVV